MRRVRLRSGCEVESDGRVSWYLTGHERRRCPAHFQERINRAGGFNRFGGPNFDIVWGQTATIRADGKPVLQQFGDACWVLRQWNPPEAYGTPELWEMDEVLKRDPFPYRGRYEIVQPFKWAGVVNGRLVQEFMPLTSLIVDRIIPIVMQCKEASYWKRYVALRDAQEKKDKAQTDRIADNLMDASPAWYGPVSYSRQGCKSSFLQQKMEAIEKNWKRMIRLARILPRGASCFQTPPLPYNN